MRGFFKGLAERNLCLNKKYRDFFQGDRLINGQGLEKTSEMHYGLCRMGYNGCGIIAVYNALTYIEKKQPLSDIAYHMERYRMLFGILGCNPYRLGKALSHYGAAFERFGDSEAFIVSYWTGIRFFSSIHTVFCVKTSDGINVYNKFNNCPTVKYNSSLRELTNNKKPIVVYNII